MIAVRVVWGLCLVLGAMVAGVGIELYSSGAAPWVSYPVVVGGIAFLPLASAAIGRLVAEPVSTRE